MGWIKNTAYTMLGFGIAGAIASSQSGMVSDAYERSLKTETRVLEKYGRKHSLEEEIEQVREKYQKFKEEGKLYKAKEIIINPKDSYKAVKDYGRVDFSELFTKKSLNGLKYGALSGFLLRILLGIRALKKRKKRR